VAASDGGDTMALYDVGLFTSVRSYGSVFVQLTVVLSYDFHVIVNLLTNLW